ncbi:hypothetical protein VT84_07005 [Gemmata sp. SH-PL17]|uniref:hypothetical protein n=1 Tax=Gemmata sp. SH-PL17 TaxID=1630693 RepID=UPI00078D3507|nr:hypothetical protein [Gemmata sp. SH-PL17]AMV24128.1 hypothetical protein VT84_07005 [Gemmata sp. SH-PL17]
MSNGTTAVIGAPRLETTADPGRHTFAMPVGITLSPTEAIARLRQLEIARAAARVDVATKLPVTTPAAAREAIASLTAEAQSRLNVLAAECAEFVCDRLNDAVALQATIDELTMKMPY